MIKGYKITISVGIALISFAVILAGYNVISDNSARKVSAGAVNTLDSLLKAEVKAESTVPDYILNPDMDMPVQNIDGVSYIGVLQIPDLKLELPVSDTMSYRLLRKAPCRFYGTAYKGNFVICAHNYSSHFGRLSRLDCGDEIIFTDNDGNIFTYRVEALEVLKPNEVDEMQSEQWDLTLFTCTVGGQSRVTVRCLKID